MPVPSVGHSLIVPLSSVPALASRPSASAASDEIRLPCEKNTGFPLFFGHSFIVAGGVVAGADQSPVWQLQHGRDRPAKRKILSGVFPPLFGQSLTLPSSPPVASLPSASHTIEETRLP